MTPPYSGLDFLVSYKKSTFVECHSGDIDPILPSHPKTLLALLVFSNKRTNEMSPAEVALAPAQVENPGRNRVAAQANLTDN